MNLIFTKKYNIVINLINIKLELKYYFFVIKYNRYDCD
jgi:hypothetical protein